MNPHDKGYNAERQMKDTKDSMNMERKSHKRVLDNDCSVDETINNSEPAKKLPKLDQESHIKSDEESGGSVTEISCSLLNLSDDVLLQIFGYLDSATLNKLTQTCQRLRNICSDSSLWIRFDTDGVPLTVKELRSMLKFVNKRTTSITVHGFLKIRSKMHHESLTKATLENISEKCPGLQKLKMKDCFINAQNVNVPCLPTSPTSLSIVNCEVVNVPSNKSYFWEMDKRIPNLEKLDLSYNNWLTNHALYSLCKFKELKEISFRGCMRIGDTACYTMIATNFGFKNVAKLDLRDTSVGDHELSCFTKLPKLTHLWVGHSIPTSQYVPPHGSEGDGRITDRGIRSIVPHDGEYKESKLKFLDLTNTLVTDESLVDLSSSKMSLAHLIVRGTKVTVMGCMNYQAAKPNCILDHDENKKTDNNESSMTMQTLIAKKEEH